MKSSIEESRRLEAANAGRESWRRWGPYLSERQWGTVREDYSAGGNAWDYFPHDHARSRAYRWGEDGLAGFSDDEGRLCVALALWNGRDPILKERLFGLTNGEGNHGEDVKELYYYLDATPTHSYQRMLYKYPQREFPYAALVEGNRSRRSTEPELELLDTGVFDDDRYWDIEVEYAKAGPEDILMRITARNRGPEEAILHVLPQVWFRNTWSWDPTTLRPQLEFDGVGRVRGWHPELGAFWWQGDGDGEVVFTENHTNPRRHWGRPDATGHFKDAFHEYLVQGRRDAVHPDRRGTKAAFHRQLRIAPGAEAVVRVRWRMALAALPTEGRPVNGDASAAAFADFDAIADRRRSEADAYYSELQCGIVDEDARRVQRQALAGMLWSKQFYAYDVRRWLEGDPGQPPPPRERRRARNGDWEHLNNADVVSMPDKWEYPWYAAWDLAFHCIPMALVDATFAKEQLLLLTREWYMHPNGQLPAYEWAFGDVNPPVHAWAAWRVFQIDRKQRRERGSPEDLGDRAFLERVFHKLLLNFTWWVNRKDAQGRNIFQGGFLGLDNIGVFDRSAPLPTGGFINQADGTSWMAMYCLNLLRIALELARGNRVYEDIATKFFEHFLHIAAAINGVGGDTPALWDGEDEFYYDALHLPDGRQFPMKLRSMVGLIPLFAVEVIEPELLRELPEFAARMNWFLNHRPDLAGLVSRWTECGSGDRHLLSLLRGHRMKCLLRRALDETEFLGDYGIRSVSKVHETQPYRLQIDGQTHEVRYWPAESLNGLFGGNSNWRGPIWMPVNYLLIESLQKFHHYYGDDFRIECPVGSSQFVTLAEAADEVGRRLVRIFLRDGQGRRPVYGHQPRHAEDPHFRDQVLFYEYFDGDTGRGVGASHQTGWTGLVAKLLAPRRRPDCGGRHEASSTQEDQGRVRRVKGSELIHD
ncbi:MAG: glucosidase [Verrucomicrobiales bacterium]|nr:glucosidase [Verrucomicrobiales bacterium]